METGRMFRIDRSLQESTHAQVLRQLKQHLHFGTLRSGDRLPSVRKLASVLEINPKTAHSIYQFLEYERLVEIRPKSGVFVNGSHLADEQSRKANLAVRVRRLVREARSLGFKEEELWRFMEGSFAARQSTSLLAVVECNREVLDLLCRDLTRELKVNVVRIPLAELEGRLAEQLPKWRFLLTTEYHVQEVRNAVRGLGKEVYGIRWNYAIFEKIQEDLAEDRVLFIAKDGCLIDEFSSVLRNLLSGPEFDNFVGISHEDRLLVRYWLNRVRAVCVSPACPASFKEWVARNARDDVKLTELGPAVASESLKQLRDVLFLAGDPAARGPVSQSAIC